MPALKPDHQPLYPAFPSVDHASETAKGTNVTESY
jgi:hypothetical protein